jgi:CHAD domain-containing protein
MERASLPVTLLRQRLVMLLRAIPAASAGDEGSVHQARVASRRLRAALPVLGVRADASTLGRVRRQVRRITRALGPVRELDVALSHLEEYAARALVSPRALARVRQALIAERQSRRREMLDAVTPIALEKLRKRLSGVAQVPAKRVVPQEELDEAARRMARRAATLAEAIEHAGGIYLPDRLHQVRVAAKKLRYALEIERELRRSRSAARINRLKALQDRLGRMHDLEILIDRVRRVQGSLAERERSTALALDALIRAMEQDCRADHALYMRERAALQKLCAELRRPQHDHPTAAA